jgi:hypothetical protein
MPARRFERIRLELLLSGCAVMFGAYILIEHAQAQPGYVPPPTPLPPPVLNPSNPNTVPQPSYRPITPTTPSTTPSIPTTVPSGEVRSPVSEGAPSTTARSERETSITRTRSVHHHHRGAGPTLGSFYCPYGWCVRIFSVCLLPAIWLVSLLRRGGSRRISAKLPELRCGNGPLPGPLSLVYSCPAMANSKILATVAALNPARCVALVPCAVFTVTSPSRDRLYEPLTILPLIGILTSFHIIGSVMRRILVEAAPCVHPAKTRIHR